MFDVKTFDIEKYDTIIAKGLSVGKGSPDELMCIEAVICNVLGMPHSDDPQCVAASVRQFKMFLNDSFWSSTDSRAKHLRDLGLAQLGSLGVVDDTEFSTRIAFLTVQQLIPSILREVFSDIGIILNAAQKCEDVVDISTAFYAIHNTQKALGEIGFQNLEVFRALDAAMKSFSDAIENPSVSARCSVYVAREAEEASRASRKLIFSRFDHEKYLIMSANFALKVLKDLNSPGCALLTPACDL
jgi:hypothetical protein